MRTDGCSEGRGPRNGVDRATANKALFRNLYFQVSSFGDFNFSDCLDRLEQVREEYIEARVRESYSGEPIEPYFDPIIPLTLRPESCSSFIRANPSLPIAERDYYLSKLFQFLYITITAKFDLGFDHVGQLREQLEAALDRLSEGLLPLLHGFDWWGFHQAVDKCDPERGHEGQDISRILGNLAAYLPQPEALSSSTSSSSTAPNSVPAMQAARVREAWRAEEWHRKLREARAQHGQAQKEAADWCGVAVETYKKWEQGRTPAERNIPRIVEYIVSGSRKSAGS